MYAMIRVHMMAVRIVLTNLLYRQGGYTTSTQGLKKEKCVNHAVLRNEGFHVS